MANTQQLSIEISDGKIHITEQARYTAKGRRQHGERTYTAKIADNLTKKQAVELGVLLIQAAGQLP